MTDLSKDPVINIINNGIKRDIRVLLENRGYRGAVILIYSGIDVMASLGMPEGQVDVKRDDFISWADRYIKFPCDEQVTGEELYGARCGFLHTYTPHSKLSRVGKCRILSYADKSIPEVRYNPHISKELVIVSVPAFAEAFFVGVDTFLVDIYSSSEKARVADERFKNLFKALPAKK
jgi:hypothetical protein